MEQKTIKAIIECGEDGGFTAFSESVPGVYANGLTEDEVRKEFLEMMEEQAEFMERRTGKAPDFKGAKVEFTYDLTALFSAFPFLNVSALAEWMGINPSLMRKYKVGLSTPRGKNREAIQNGLKRLSERLQEVYV